MKLRKFNQSNLPVVSKGKPTIRLSLSSGLISISPVAGEILGLTKKSHVEFCQNEETPSDWYLHITNAPRDFLFAKRMLVVVTASIVPQL